MTCTACSSPMRVDDDARAALLAWTLPNLGVRLQRLLAASGVSAREEADGLLWVEFGDRSATEFLEMLEAGLSPAALSHCRAVLCPADARLSAMLVTGMKPLSSLVALSRSEWLLDCMERDALEVHLQPILDARDGRSVYAHECLLRARDQAGQLVPADRLFAAAEAADLMFQLDRAARLAAIETVSRQGLDGKVFINFNPTSVYDPAFCLRTTLAAARRSGIPLERFVFEIVESSAVADPDRLRRILDVYRGAGCGVALDDLGAGFSSLNLLAAVRPDYVKFDRELVQGVAGDEFKQVMLRKLLELARDLGITTIAEGVEEESDWRLLQDAGVDLVQGFLFARPAATPWQPAA